MGVSGWWSIEVFDAEQLPARRWKDSYQDELIEAALTNGAVYWEWHEHRYGVVFEVLFDSDAQWEAFRALPVVRAALDGVPDPVNGLIIYPGLVSAAVASALGSEPVTAYVVHHDAIFDPGMEVRRHMTVLVLTPTRLVYSHTDEHPAEDADSRPRAETSTEAVRFAQISSVALTRVVPDPAAYVPGVTLPSEVMLTIGWNVLSHLEPQPAHCGDQSREADPRYPGPITADDFPLRVSPDADGEDAVQQLLSFVPVLSDATAAAR